MEDLWNEMFYGFDAVQACFSSLILKYFLLCRNVVSFSDGLPDKGRGIPYFYLTTLDPTARNALKDQRSSFTISEYAIGTCGKKDPENPSCAKITLVGKVVALTTLLLYTRDFVYFGAGVF